MMLHVIQNNLQIVLRIFVNFVKSILSDNVKKPLGFLMSSWDKEKEHCSDTGLMFLCGGRASVFLFVERRLSTQFQAGTVFLSLVIQTY